MKGFNGTEQTRNLILLHGFNNTYLACEAQTPGAQTNNQESCKAYDVNRDQDRSHQKEIKDAASRFCRMVEGRRKYYERNS